MDWGVEFYEDEQGNQPVQTFFDGLNPKPRAKALQAIQMLVEFGTQLPFPYSSQVEGRLRELRIKFGGMNYRVFYYADSNRTFVLLHGIVKKTARLPKTDIEIATQRMNADMETKRR